MTTPQAHLVKSAQRVLQVLEYFDVDRPSATVTDISRALSYPQSSTSVLLRCLRALGYLYYNRYHRTYRPTARAALLGCWAEEGNYRGGRMLDLVDTIGGRVGETVLLSTASADYATHHLHVARGSNPNAVPMRTGEIEPMLHSVQGELVLASYPDPQIRLALHRLNSEQEDPDQRVNIGTKLAQMQEMRRRGWNMSDDAGGNDVGAVAVFLPRRKGGDRIALSIVADRKVVAERGEEFLQVILEERDRLFDEPCEDPAAAPSNSSDVVSLQRALESRAAMEPTAPRRKAAS